MKSLASTCALAALLVVSTAAAQEFQERVIDLPTTEGKWHLTAVYFNLDTPTEADRALKESLQNHPGLQHLQKQVIVHEYDNRTPLVRTNEWATYLGNLRPALLLQAPHDQNGAGNVVYFASGRHLQTGDRLAKSLRYALNNYRTEHGYTHCSNEKCPCDQCDCDPCECDELVGQGRRCPRCPAPRPTPEPQPVSPAPAPQPAPQPVPQTVPDLPDELTEADRYVPLWAVAIPFIGAAAGLYVALKRDASNFQSGDDDEEDLG
jgi:hypothetical protein